MDLTDIQKTRKETFEKELKDLLCKHGVSLHLTDDGRSYGMHSPVLDFEFDCDSESGYFELTLDDIELT